MLQQTPPHSVTVSGRAFHIPDLVRAAMLVVALGVIANFTLFNEHLIFGAVAWIVFVAAVLAAVALALRIVLVDAPAPADPALRVERTRMSGVIKEIAVGGAGGLMLLGPVLWLCAVTSEAVWAGRVQPPEGASIIGLVFALGSVGLGFMLVFWRPQYVLHRAAGIVTRHAFGRSMPFRVARLAYRDLVIYSDGYWITNSGERLGDMVRGRIGKHTFELELLRGNLPAEVVQHRTMAWATALGARYCTPVEAAAIELQGGAPAAHIHSQV